MLRCLRSFPTSRDTPKRELHTNPTKTIRSSRNIIAKSQSRNNAARSVRISFCVGWEERKVHEDLLPSTFLIAMETGGLRRSMPVESTPSKTLAPSRTVDQVLGQIPVGRYHYLLMIMAGLVFMADALEVTLLSFLASCAGVEFDLTDAQMAMITTAVFIGQIVGNLIWGPIADKYGRRFAFLRSATMICVFSWLSGASPNFASLVVFRTFCGVGIGGELSPF